MPRATYHRLHEYAETWATRGVRAWAEGWWKMPLTVGDEVGRIIGAEPGATVMHQNVSICQSLILSCFDPTPKRNKIVYSELNFPSVMYVYEAHAREGKLRIEQVKSDDGITVPLERMLAAIDEETLLVPSHTCSSKVLSCRTPKQSSTAPTRSGRRWCLTLTSQPAQSLST